MRFSVFRTPLGWTAFRGHHATTDELVVDRLTFGHRNRTSAERELWSGTSADERRASRSIANCDLVVRIERYFAGEYESLDDISIDTSMMTGFQRRVVRLCRMIPYGQTKTYGQLAALAGAPGAARAVGNVMRTNRVPILVPCHRVVGCGGSLGGFSAPDGITMKRRLLAMEAAAIQPAVSRA
jgi:methylated-DNA-[protein]-cysteine S-methyltransferase